MKKTRLLFGILLAVMMMLTSVGMVFADDAPPPVDGLTLPPPENLNFPLKDIYINNGINFNWDTVPGADKYILELRRLNADQEWAAVLPPMSISSKLNPMVPPNTATISAKKPFPAGKYIWRITAINTDVGIDPAGTGQSSDWAVFNIVDTPWSIGDMWPGVTTTSVAYSANIDPKKGEGTNVDQPQFNWKVTNGTLGSIGATTQFRVTLSQGKNKWSQIVAGSSCTTIDSEEICSAPLAGFSGPLALGSLTAGKTYTWEVLGQDQPADKTLFPSPSTTMPALNDVVEYNPDDPPPSTLERFPPLKNAIVTDALFTNKPTFGWAQPSSAMPARGVYQIVTEKDDAATAAVVWTPAFSATIVPNVTKIPGSTQIACPTGGDCYWRFAGLFNQKYNYRWNVRILAAGKYGPWAEARVDLVSGRLPNEFSTPGKPSSPPVIMPSYNQVDTNPKPFLKWMMASYFYRYWDPIDKKVMEGYYPAIYYQIDLKRVSPAPLTGTAISREIYAGEGDLDGDGDPNEHDHYCYTDKCEIPNLEDILPSIYDTYGLPRGSYQLVLSARMKYLNGQAGVFPSVKSWVQKFVIGPAFPTGLAAAYTAADKKMNVTFDQNTAYPAESVKYRILVKMQVNGGLWRWVKIGTYAGTSCPTGGATCTLNIPVYKPGTTQALAGGTYAIQIQEALKEEGNPKKDKLWGPFGPLSNDAALIIP